MMSEPSTSAAAQAAPARPQEWFSAWFDSVYYHRLYRERDQPEAHRLLDNLSEWLRLKPGARLLDLACGRGRHSVDLRKRGFDVTGVDLSPSSIAYAKQFEDEHLRFRVHDMRESLGEPNHYDCILNLFTSFGYFNSEAENVLVLQAIAEALRPGGELVLDYLNTHRVERTLVAEEVKTEGGTEFQLSRRIHDGYFEKRIRFTDDNGQPQVFTERVMALWPEQFEEYFHLAGLRVRACFGTYDLGAYDPETSPRLIYILKK
jgi:SAM-dependent methyltransferase